MAYPADKNFEDAYPGVSGGPPVIPAGNLTGLPALAMPNGFGENGLPTSIAFLGAAVRGAHAGRDRLRLAVPHRLAFPQAPPGRLKTPLTEET